MIKSIELTNWQKHKSLKLDFNKGINVITGQSNAGKSCIRRALGWVLFNDNLREQDYRREGTKETSVIVILDNGAEIERVRSNTTNRYILRINDEEKVFDSFGKIIPQEIQDVINVSLIEIDNDKLNLNIAEQLTLPFLLDKPASFRAKLFNKLTGNELLDSLFKELNKESLRINRETKNVEENLKTQEEQLANCSTEYKELRKKLDVVQEHYQKIQEEIEIYENLKDLADKLKANKEGQEFVDFQKSKIKTVSEEKINQLKNEAKKLEKIVDMATKLQGCEVRLEKIKMDREDFAKVPDVNFDELKTNVESFQNMKRLQEQSLQNMNDLKDVQFGIYGLQEKMKCLKKDLDEVWAECDVCPLCGKERCDENL